MDIKKFERVLQKAGITCGILGLLDKEFFFSFADGDGEREEVSGRIMGIKVPIKFNKWRLEFLTDVLEPHGIDYCLLSLGAKGKWQCHSSHSYRFWTKGELKLK